MGWVSKKIEGVGRGFFVVCLSERDIFFLWITPVRISSKSNLSSKVFTLKKICGKSRKDMSVLRTKLDQNYHVSEKLIKDINIETGPSQLTLKSQNTFQNATDKSQTNILGTGPLSKGNKFLDIYSKTTKANPLKTNFGATTGFQSSHLRRNSRMGSVDVPKEKITGDGYKDAGPREGERTINNVYNSTKANKDFIGKNKKNCFISSSKQQIRNGYFF